MNLEFKDKYLKYKKKYLELKDLMAGGESKLLPLTPEQERAVAFFDIMEPHIFFNGKNIKNLYNLEIIEKRIKKCNDFLEHNKNELERNNKDLKIIEGEIEKENKKIIKTGERLKLLEERKKGFDDGLKMLDGLRKKYLSIADSLNKAKSNIKDVNDAKLRISNNLTKYFEIDIEKKTNIVKIKDLKTLFDDLEILSKSMISHNAQSKMIENAGWDEKSFDYPMRVELLLGDLSIPPELLDHRPHVEFYAKSSDTEDFLKKLISDMSDFKKNYLNTDSKKYLNSDIIYDNKTIEGTSIDEFIKKTYSRGAMPGIAYYLEEKEKYNSKKPKKRYNFTKNYDDFVEVDLGSVEGLGLKYHDEYGTTGIDVTPNLRMFIPNLIPKECPYNVPYCKNIDEYLKEAYPNNYVFTSSEGELGLISDDQIKKIIEEKIKDTNLKDTNGNLIPESMRKFLDRGFVRLVKPMSKKKIFKKYDNTEEYYKKQSEKRQDFKKWYENNKHTI